MKERYVEFSRFLEPLRLASQPRSLAHVTLTRTSYHRRCRICLRSIELSTPTLLDSKDVSVGLLFPKTMVSPLRKLM